MVIKTSFGIWLNSLRRSKTWVGYLLWLFCWWSSALPSICSGQDEVKTINALFEDRAKTRFLRACDVFEPSKAVVRHVVLDVVDDFGQCHVEQMIKATEGQPYGVIALFDGERVYFRDSSIQSISDGAKFVSLDAYLEAHVAPVAV